MQEIMVQSKIVYDAFTFFNHARQLWSVGANIICKGEDLRNSLSLAEVSRVRQKKFILKRGCFHFQCSGPVFQLHQVEISC